MQCAEAEAVFASPNGEHRICGDCSNLNLTAHLLGARDRGEVVLRLDDEAPSEPVPFYVAPVHEIHESKGR